MTCPGAQIHQLSERKKIDDFSRLGIKKIAILPGTNNIAWRDGSTHQPEEISDQMKDLVEMEKNEGFQVVLMEDSWRRHREKEIKKINRQYEKIAKKATCEFHRYRRFSTFHIDKNDGVHSAADHIQILAKEFYQALQRLSTDKSNGGHTSGASGTLLVPEKASGLERDVTESETEREREREREIERIPRRGKYR